MTANTGKASRLHGFTAIRVMTAMLMLLHLSKAAAQTCPTGCPAGCPTTCDVDTQAELQAALDCYDDSNGATCSHIRIPPNTTLVVTTSQFSLNGGEHDGLHIEIAGTISFAGTAGTGHIFHLNGCDDVAIDGGGTITSIHDPFQVALGNVATTFRITNAADGITIRDLTVTNLTDVIKVEPAGATDLTVINVHGRNLGDYGIFLNHNRTTAHIENCSMTLLKDEHPFRLYGDDVTVLNCWSHGSGKTGLWTPEGDDVRIDRFSSDKWLRFGPDNGASDPDPLTDLDARELETTDYVRAEIGLQNACLVNLCGDLTVGRTASQVAHSLALTDFKWDEVSSYTIVSNTLIDYPATVNVVDYNYCFSDIDRDNAVGVADLLAVITSWGSCPAPPSGYSAPPPPCAGDISPTICGDDTVNVSDLLKVINDWGGCEAHPVCGPLAATDAGTPEDAPETISECWIEASNAFPNNEEQRNEAFEACVNALNELN